MSSFNRAILSVLARQSKASFLKAFKPDGKPVTIPVKELYHVSAAVDKDEQRSRKRVFTHLGSHNPAEAIEGFTHITGRAIKVYAGGACQGEHEPAPRHWLRVAITHLNAEGSKPRASSIETVEPKCMRMPESAPGHLGSVAGKI